MPPKLLPRMKNELYDIADDITLEDKKNKPYVFVRIRNHNQLTLTRQTKQAYTKSNLQNIIPWLTGKLPKAYCNVENKDNGNQDSSLPQTTHPSENYSD